MVTLVMAILLLLLALAAMLYPFFQRRGERSQGFSVGSQLQELLDRRETLLQGMRELENDRTLGNLGEAEYARLRDDDERQAATVLKALDERAGDSAGKRNTDLNREIQEAKARLAAGTGTIKLGNGPTKTSLGP